MFAGKIVDIRAVGTVWFRRPDRCRITAHVMQAGIWLLRGSGRAGIQAYGGKYIGKMRYGFGAGVEIQGRFDEF